MTAATFQTRKLSADLRQFEVRRWLWTSYCLVRTTGFEALEPQLDPQIVTAIRQGVEGFEAWRFAPDLEAAGMIGVDYCEVKSLTRSEESATISADEWGWQCKHYGRLYVAFVDGRGLCKGGHR